VIARGTADRGSHLRAISRQGGLVGAGGELLQLDGYGAGRTICKLMAHRVRSGAGGWAMRLMARAIWPDPVHRSTCCESWWLLLV
jgi:hypothetical protein